jgi:hypothetical protein
MRYGFVLLMCLITPLTHAEDDPKATFGFDPQPMFGAWISTESLHVAVPKDGGSIHAFSARTGRWTHLTLKTKLPDDAYPIVNGEMAVIQTKDTIYAIGSQMKEWKTLKLETPGRQALVSGWSVRVEDGRHLFLIGADSEHWEGVDLDTGSVILPPSD